MERIWKEVVMAYFKVLSWFLSGTTAENHKKAQSGQPVSRPRFEPGTYRILSRSANYSATTFSLLTFPSRSFSIHLSYHPTIADRAYNICS
jgi:hypothetical protein